MDSAKLGQSLGNLAAGKLSDYRYEWKKAAHWALSSDSKWVLNNINMVDVDKGEIFREKAILVDGKQFGKRLEEEEVKTLRKKPEITAILDGKERYLVPGMSDLHCHLSLVSEYGLKLSGLHYFDAQRMKNCEFALSKGCTTVRDSNGAFDMVHGLKMEIENGRLLGPIRLPSHAALSPPGGMWDINPVMNKLAEMVFGGKILNFPRNEDDIKRAIETVVEMGAFSIKIFLEDKPIYGGKESTTYNMFSHDQVEMIRRIADEHGKLLESHALFIKGARKAIRGKVDSIAHLTLDESYSEEDAERMVENGVAIVPTFSVGSYLAMDCGKNGYPDHEEYQFFRSMLNKHVKKTMEEATIPQLSTCYSAFYDFIEQSMPDRKMPGFGKVYPERCHGFGVFAPKSVENFKKAGTKIGVGTDGGTGTCFAGAFDIEFESYLRYGFSRKEIVRMATLGNMEIIKMDDRLGSISEGKWADMLILEENPLDNVFSMTSPLKVFTEGSAVSITRSEPVTDLLLVNNKKVIMNIIEMEFYTRECERRMLELYHKNTHLNKKPYQNCRLKKQILLLGDWLIAAGSRLHNIYQPTIEQTLVDYLSKREGTGENRVFDKEATVMADTAC